MSKKIEKEKVSKKLEKKDITIGVNLTKVCEIAKKINHILMPLGEVEQILIMEGLKTARIGATILGFQDTREIKSRIEGLRNIKSLLDAMKKAAGKRK